LRFTFTWLSDALRIEATSFFASISLTTLSDHSQKRYSGKPDLLLPLKAKVGNAHLLDTISRSSKSLEVTILT